MNWDLNRGLQGMFTQWSDDRHKAIDDQAEFERQERVAQSKMAKDKEMYNWKAQREGQAAETERTRVQEERTNYLQRHGIDPASRQGRNFMLTGQLDPTAAEKAEDATTLSEAQSAAELKHKEASIQQTLDKSGHAPGSPEYVRLEKKLRGTQSTKELAVEEVQAAAAKANAMADVAGLTPGTQERDAFINQQITGRKAREQLSEKDKADYRKESIKMATDYIKEDPEFANSFGSTEEAINSLAESYMNYMVPQIGPSGPGPKGVGPYVSPGAKKVAAAMPEKEVVAEAKKIQDEAGVEAKVPDVETARLIVAANEDKKMGAKPPPTVEGDVEAQEPGALSMFGDEEPDPDFGALDKWRAGWAGFKKALGIVSREELPPKKNEGWIGQ